MTSNLEPGVYSIQVSEPNLNARQATTQNPFCLYENSVEVNGTGVFRNFGELHLAI